MKSQKPEDAQQPEKVTVLLIKDHEHAGKPCRAGDEIEVTAAQHTWLREQGVVE